MEYILILIACLITIVILYFALGVNIRKIKEIGNNKKLNELASKFPENEEICKSILKKLKNEKTKVKQNEDKENKTSLYVAISNTIFIANIKDTYTRIQTIAHECIHSTQSKRMLLFNFYYSNIYLLYFAISIILTIVGVFKNYNLQIVILLLMSTIYYVIRSYLETDAMIKAKYVAEEYIKEYIKENKIISKEEGQDIVEEYERINKIGIPTYNFLLINSNSIRIGVYIMVVIILDFIR